jgi:fibronectin-binding autotransporter adhesin
VTLFPMRRPDGQILTLFVLALIPILLVMAVVLDGGYAWTQRRGAQTAADFAALAGARIVMQNASGTSRTDGDVATAMQTVATANRSSIAGLGTAAGPWYTDSTGAPLSPNVNVGATTSTSSIPTAARGVAVSATSTWQPLVAGVVGASNWTARADATARFQMGAASPCAICVLNGVAATSNSVSMTANEGSIYINGALGGSNSTTITANHGSILASGNLTVSNSSTFTSVGGSILVTGNLSGTNSSRFIASTGSVSVNGNLSVSNSSTVSAANVNVQGTVTVGGSSSVTPSPTSTGPITISVTDPLAWLSQPTNPNSGATPTSYTCQNSATCTYNPGIGILANVTVRNSATATLYPGIYNRIAVSNSSTVNLQPGTYYVAGTSGSVTVDNSSRIVGLGAVTLVFLDQTSLSVANSAGLQVTAPAPTLPVTATYPWPGVAIYAARGNTATISLANSSTNPVVGAVYARDAALTTANSSSVGVQSLIVVGSYTAANSSSLTTTYDVSQNPQMPGGSLQLVR